MKNHTLVGALLAGLLLALPLSMARADAPPLCVTVVSNETIDGAKADSSRAGSAVVAALTKAGWCVVDPASLGGVQEALASGKIAGRFLDVDWIVSLKVDSNKLGAGVMGTSFVRYEAGLEAKVLVSDTGDVVSAVNLKGQGMDLQPRASALMAAEQAGKKLAKTFEKEATAWLRKDARMKLVVQGVPDSKEVESIARMLGQVDGVRGARARSFASNEAQYDLDVSGRSAAEVASGLDGARGLGLAIQGYTLRRLTANYSAVKRVKISVTVGPFENSTGNRAESWMSTAIPKVLVTELSNVPALAVATAGEDGKLPAKLVEVPAFLKGSKKVESLLYCTGAYDYKGSKGQLRVSVFRVDDGAQLFTMEKVGDVRSFRKVILEAARSMVPETVATVMKRPKLRELAGAANFKQPNERLAERQEARLKGVTIDSLLATDRLKGQIELAQLGDLPPSATVSVRLPEASDAMERLQLSDAKEARIPFELTLGKERPKEPKPMQLEVELSFRSGGKWHSERLVHPVVLFPDAVASWMGGQPH